MFEKCEYTCGLCKEKLPTHSQHRAHIRSAHKHDITLKEYLARYGHCQKHDSQATVQDLQEGCSTYKTCYNKAS